MIRTLVMDRSSEDPGVAVFDGDQLLFDRQWDGNPTRAPAWMDDLAIVLREHQVSPASIDRFVCGIGPGSFSGIRACLSALQGMALPGSKPIFGIASAATLALQVAAQEGALVTVIGDARRNRLWCVTYRVFPKEGTLTLADGGIPKQTAEDFKLITTDELSGAIPEGATVVSSDWNRLEELLRKTVPAERLIDHPCFPKARDLGRLSCESKTELCLKEPLPIYLHPAVAK